MTDEELDSETQAVIRRQTQLIVVFLVVCLVALAAFCWINRDSVWRGVLARALDRDQIADGDGCAPFIGAHFPEVVEAVRAQFADPDSVRPIKTLVYDRNSAEAQMMVRMFNADPAGVAVDMKFAARNKAGAMQFFTAGGSLDPQSCAFHLLTIVDDDGKVLMIDMPTPAPSR